jgi:hypothetical protein
MAASIGARLKRKAARTAVSVAPSHPFRRCYGTEFISRDLDLWAYAKGVTLDFLPARQADRQRLHRSLQWSAPG